MRQQKNEEELQSCNLKKKNNKKYLPKGCYHPKQQQKYLMIQKFIQENQMYKIICPFRYNYMPFVIVQEGQKKNDNSVFSLYHQASRTLLLKAQKIENVIGSKYAIYEMKQRIKCEKAIGYVRGNILDNEFNIFDSGYNPKKKLFPIRHQLGFIKFEKSSMFSMKPPTSKFVLPFELGHAECSTQIYFLEVSGIQQKDESHCELQEKQYNNSGSVFTLKTQAPTLNVAKNIYELDFKKMVTQTSPVNCILKNSVNEECLMVGKRSSNTFIMYLGYPVTLLQGFGYFIANFINKHK